MISLGLNAFRTKELISTASAREGAKKGSPKEIILLIIVVVVVVFL
jgi:hypothetical protein